MDLKNLIFSILFLTFLQFDGYCQKINEELVGNSFKAKIDSIGDTYFFLTFDNDSCSYNVVKNFYGDSDTFDIKMDYKIIGDTLFLGEKLSNAITITDSFLIFRTVNKSDTLIKID